MKHADETDDSENKSKRKRKRGDDETDDTKYKVKKKHVYSNSKFLADFGDDVTLKVCTRWCNNWADVCPDVCKKAKKCGLSDDDARDGSCKTKCAGFNMHSDTHCTLFSSDVKLLTMDHGGGTFYAAPGAELSGKGCQT